MSQIKQKAAERKHTVDEQIRMDAEYMFNLDHNDSQQDPTFAKLVQQEMDKINSNPDMLHRVEEKAKAANRPIAEIMNEEAIYAVSLEGAMYKFKW